MLRLRILGTAVVVLVSGACAPAEPSRTLDRASSPQPSHTAHASPSAQASPTAISVPSRLIGTWRSDLSKFRKTVCLQCGRRARLTLDEDGTYTLHRGITTTSGRLAFEGKRIVFLGNELCDGIGAYEWKVSGESLVMTSVKPDECFRRAEALDGPTYTRVN
jgi:hypothetical protein